MSSNLPPSSSLRVKKSPPVVLQCSKCRSVLAETLASSHLDGKWRVRVEELAADRVSTIASNQDVAVMAVVCVSCNARVGKELGDDTNHVLLDEVESYELRRSVATEELAKLENDVLDIKEVLMTILSVPEEVGGATKKREHRQQQSHGVVGASPKKRRGGRAEEEAEIANSPFSSPQRVMV